MRSTVFFLFMICFLGARAQSIENKLSLGFQKFERDSQFEQSVVAMYVAESNTGKVVFEKNANVGMAPASTQKVITSITAFDVLGKNFTYKTYIGYDGIINNSGLDGNLFVIGSGDPTLGSWRWKTTTQENVISKIISALQKKNIKLISGRLYIDDLCFSYQPIPDGWIWQDIGNYYGAGAWSLNWYENQYDLFLKSTGALNESTEIVGTYPIDLKSQITNWVKSAKKGSGDNVYIYAAPYNKEIFATGTIPIGQEKFKVSGSNPHPPLSFGTTLIKYLNQQKISIAETPIIYSGSFKTNTPVNKMTQYLDSIVSPSFDSMNYWFLKKSVNLYGETFLKTMSTLGNQIGNTDSGVAFIKNYWKAKGIPEATLKILDGSGLSTGNRVTCKTMVNIMRYAQKQDWFPSFYYALPEMNGIKMKDGYINGVRSYTGYVKSKSGVEYCFAFIVNNFDGSASTVREKMWKVLDLLK